MNTQEAILKRKSVRAFLDQNVKKEDLIKILEVAKYAPSGTNIQPWEVAVVTGDKKDRLLNKLEKEFRSGVSDIPDYEYYPNIWKEPFKSRRRACGLQLYKAVGIQRGEKDKQLDQWAKNFRAFDAPAVLFFFMDKDLKTGSYLDYGMFIQNIALVAQDLELSSCIQAAFIQYPTIIKKELGYENKILVCAIAIGYEDKNAQVNNYSTPREDLKNFVRFFD